MEYTQQEIYRYLEDKGHQFFIWDGKPAADDSFVEHTVDYMSLYICRKGQISFDLHGKNMKADCNCVQFFMKDHTTKITSVSDDYNSIGIIFSKSYWTESLMDINPDLALSFLNPVLHLQPEEIQVLLSFLKAIQLIRKTGETENSPVLRSLFSGILFQLGFYYQNWAKDISMYTDARVLVEFTHLLFQHCHQHRDVTFYAESLHLDRSKFSRKIKANFGFSALHCIDGYIFTRICSELKNTDKSVKEIALDYNYHDTSHLCKFFRKMSGMSPDSYRQKARQQMTPRMAL